MDRAVLAIILLAGCSFTPGIPRSGETPDASLPRSPDAPVVSPSSDAPTVATSCHSQLPGVHLCLDFESSHLSTDSSGYPHSIAMHDVQHTTRGNQQAALLDSSSTISIQDSPDLDLSGPLSMEMWVEPTGYLQSDAYFVSNTNQYGFFVENGQLMCGIAGADGGSALVSSPSSLPTRTWTHVACVFDGTKLMLYVGGNGVDCTQQTMTIDTQQRQGLQIGLALTGGIDDIHVYGAALGDADVCQLATGGTSCTPAKCH